LSPLLANVALLVLDEHLASKWADGSYQRAKRRGREEQLSAGHLENRASRRSDRHALDWGRMVLRVIVTYRFGYGYWHFNSRRSGVASLGEAQLVRARPLPGTDPMGML
jgi:hypothetical protein